MTSQKKDWAMLALSLSPFVALPLGIYFLTANNYVLGPFLVCYAATSSIGCIRLLADFLAHGIHNDR